MRALMFCTALTMMLAATDAQAGLLSRLRGSSGDDEGKTIEGVETLSFSQRALYVHTPSRLPPSGERALVVVLHGGLGNAERIAGKRNESAMNLNDVADKYGFVVAYLNGSPVTKRLGADKRGWNAGDCCGESAAKQAPDLEYIEGSLRFLGERYGINPARIYGIGHSNGGMMTLRILCETNLYAGGIAFSGTLGIDAQQCPYVQGKPVMSVLGVNDTSVPFNGGEGKGVSGATFRSQAYTQTVFVNSGAHYVFNHLPEAEHKMETIEDALVKQQGNSLAEMTAKFFGLAQ